MGICQIDYGTGTLRKNVFQFQKDFNSYKLFALKVNTLLIGLQVK
jgi:hypothetical protein